MCGKEKILKHLFIKASLSSSAENSVIHVLNKFQPSVNPFWPTCAALRCVTLLVRGEEDEFDELNLALCMAGKYPAS